MLMSGRGNLSQILWGLFKTLLAEERDRVPAVCDGKARFQGC